MQFPRHPRNPTAAYIDGLIAHTAKLNREALAAHIAGRDAEALVLLEQAEMLAADITDCVDECEAQQLRLERENRHENRRENRLCVQPPRRIRTTQALRLGVGMSLAAGAMMVEL